ncbi:endo alpha-1,4 polygalactosaminidase [Nocardioides caldifontis]|uniref:endo alpha-1,4 polygalactosaminidase n=1 Tax=Nocardioides caldifontis TaxID=2588938 RepID=UPI0011DF920C|nr:endo alpha-1,4 polygalactosaminidase [Nocardioides caldifontis]
MLHRLGTPLATLLLATTLALILAPAASAAPAPPPADADWDYQLGGPAAVADHVGVVARDREAAPLPGKYNICYVNGFQTQPDERRFWKQSAARWRLVLKKAGKPVVDTDWGEWLLDIRTAAKRKRLTRIVGRWLDGCAAAGFQGVDLDNLDSFGRSRGLLRPAHAKAYARLLVARAHEAGLAVGQKNWVELGKAGRRIGFDFALAEECARYRECGGYTRVYGDQVLVVEYRRRDFRVACAEWGSLSVVRRDRALSPKGVRDWC